MTDVKKDDDAKPAMLKSVPAAETKSSVVEEEAVEKPAEFVCTKCKDTGSVPAEITIDQKTGEQTITKWMNCTNCYLDKDDQGNYVRKLGVKPDPTKLQQEMKEKEKILEKREEEKFARERLKRVGEVPALETVK